MRARFVNEFERGLDPKAALGLDREAKIRKCFRDLDIPDGEYEITPRSIDFYFNLNLYGKDVAWLPYGLRIANNMDLSFSTIRILPNDLQVSNNLRLNNTKITELPDDLKVAGSLLIMYTEITKIPDGLEANYIFVKTKQTELIKSIKQGKYSNNLMYHE